MRIALDLFSRYGIKGVSMDQIARKGNISKRTLYECFEDKETLLAETLEFNYIEYDKLIKRLEKDSESAVDLFFYLCEKIIEIPRWYSPKFYEELKRYPSARAVREKYRQGFHETVMKFFKRGVEEGVFHNDVNFEILVRFANDYVKMIYPSQAYSQFSAKEVYTTIVLVFTRGICTEKGNERLDRHLRRKQYDLGVK